MGMGNHGGASFGVGRLSPGRGWAIETSHGRKASAEVGLQGVMEGC